MGDSHWEYLSSSHAIRSPHFFVLFCVVNEEGNSDLDFDPAHYTRMCVLILTQTLNLLPKGVETEYEVKLSSGSPRRGVIVLVSLVASSCSSAFSQSRVRPQTPGRSATRLHSAQFYVDLPALRLCVDCCARPFCLAFPYRIFLFFPLHNKSVTALCTSSWIGAISWSIRGYVAEKSHKYITTKSRNYTLHTSEHIQCFVLVSTPEKERATS